MLVLCAAGCAQLSQKERELVFRVEPGTARWFNALPDDVLELDIPVASETPGDKPQHIHAWWWLATRGGNRAGENQATKGQADQYPAATAGQSVVKTAALAGAAAPPQSLAARTAASSVAPAVLYLHGSRWNLTGQMFRIEQLHDFGFSVLAIDYRGFGKSDGNLPSERTVYEDARAAWAQLVKLQPDPNQRFIYGHSLGGAVAVDLAANLSMIAAKNGGPPAARGLIIESTFTNLADMAHALTWSFLPVQWLLSEKFDSASKMANVHMPVLVVHGLDDRYVPSRFSQALYAAANNPKRLLLVEGGTHNNSMRLASDEYRSALLDLFDLGGASARVAGAESSPAQQTLPQQPLPQQTQASQQTGMVLR